MKGMEGKRDDGVFSFFQEVRVADKIRANSVSYYNGLRAAIPNVVRSLWPSVENYHTHIG